MSTDNIIPSTELTKHDKHLIHKSRMLEDKYRKLKEWKARMKIHKKRFTS